MRILVVSSKDKAGKPLNQCKLVPVTLTVDNGKVVQTIQEPIIIAKPVLPCRIPSGKK